jgi:histidinol phosphatase-like enzyme (inositol monophosphatase family)
MSKSTSWSDLTDFACHLAHAAGEAILPHFRKNAPIDVKQHASWDPVTEGDRAGERAMRALIETHYPSHGIIGEEYGEKSSDNEFTWILDPVDGTRAFVIGLPTWTTLIGLYQNGVPKLGVMCQPFIGDMFYGTPEGAWLNHRGNIEKLHVRPAVPLSNAAVGTTTPHLYKDADHDGFERLRRAAKVTRYGGDAYFFSLLAAGHLDIAMDAGLQVYDIAALIPIINGAGGVVGSWSTNDVTQGGHVLAASSQALLEEAQAIMQG